ncbi:hypothetical protein [Nocardia tenerifensis]|nr:hypothetical protein [Nocardia tenerifensis]
MRLAQLAFADEVLRAAARPERIAAVVARILGDRLDIGPVPLGPGGVLTARAVGTPEHIRIEPSDTDCREVGVVVPISLRLDVSLGAVSARFIAGVRVRTRITLVPDQPCALLFLQDEVRRSDVVARVHGENVLGKLAERAGGIDAIVVDHVVDYANSLFTSPELAELRRIDVADLIDRAWNAGLILGPDERAVPA